ncbi:hypothetical protein LEP1GSC050_2788 [Leptospira broomii serovar Hurstbridge str. 5399]|uniref:Uncharacterized protein n=1 Tax=Leptospira broomii serovar Hurstbridge str. 5399 TaxID=1049789 RepID=T0GAI4_9LEPT|nr:hypothetical protein [Leptospira broomii]EQA43844.1 hypothetical protein LEP1GSC050_2788 [Leptospira broomii serovar Hurstbridge str. 5399]
MNAEKKGDKCIFKVIRQSLLLCLYSFFVYNGCAVIDYPIVKRTNNENLVESNLRHKIRIHIELNDIVRYTQIDNLERRLNNKIVAGSAPQKDNFLASLKYYYRYSKEVADQSKYFIYNSNEIQSETAVIQLKVEFTEKSSTFRTISTFITLFIFPYIFDSEIILSAKITGNKYWEGNASRQFRQYNFIWPPIGIPVMVYINKIKNGTGYIDHEDIYKDMFSEILEKYAEHLESEKNHHHNHESTMNELPQP